MNMKCPIDQTTLTITERQGVEIDYCPTCRGVWLDRGELDKIIDRAEQFSVPAAQRPAHTEHHNDDRRDHDYSRDERRHHDDESHHGGHHDSHRKPHKKESFMSDLFDF